MNRDEAYLHHIFDAVQVIGEFTHGVTEEQFKKNREKQSAVILQLTLIGEMAKRVSNETREEIALPWKDIAGFRDRAIHDYYTIALKIVWGTVVHDLPVVEKEVRQWFDARGQSL